MKNIALLITFLAFSLSSYCQSSYDDMYLKHKQEDVKASWNLYDSYLSKAKTFDYAALGTATASAGLFVGYATLKEKFEMDSNGEVTMKSNAKGYLIAGGVMGFISVLLEIQAIQYRFKAGRMISLKSSENGAALSFNF